jgi:diaminopimelate decarboxylase
VYDLGGQPRDDDLPTTTRCVVAGISTRWSALPERTCHGLAQLIIGPGRSMVASAAVPALYRIVALQRGLVTFVAVDSGIDNLSGAVWPSGSRPGWPIGSTPQGREVTSRWYRHCESGDVLVERSAPGSRHERVHDLVAVPVTGAYCFTMSNNYNGNRRIPVVFVSDGRARLVVRRETWSDLLLRDVD